MAFLSNFNLTLSLTVTLFFYIVAHLDIRQTKIPKELPLTSKIVTTLLTEPRLKIFLTIPLHFFSEAVL